MPGGLARVLARVALPPVAVPRASAAQSPAVVRSTFFDPTIDGGLAAPSSARRVAAAQRRPAAVSLPGEAAALADPSPSPPGPETWLPAPDAVVMEEEQWAAPAEARLAPARHAPPPNHGREPEVGRPTESRPGPVAFTTAAQGAEPVPPLAAAAAAPATVEPGLDPPGRGAVAGFLEPARTEFDQPVPQLTRMSPAAPERPDNPDVATPPPSAPPVVIGRIEVRVDAPAAQADPFAGCRVVAGGLTARRGGAW
jgi:hypothetical protein